MDCYHLFSTLFIKDGTFYPEQAFQSSLELSIQSILPVLFYNITFFFLQWWWKLQTFQEVLQILLEEIDSEKFNFKTLWCLVILNIKSG